MPGVFILKRSFAVLVFIAAAALLVHLIADLNRVKALKTDLAEIHHVRYGLLDADQWAARISAIVERRVTEFELTDANRPRIIRAVEQVLDTLLGEIERYLRQRNLGGGGTWVDQLQGVLKQGVQDLLIDFDKLHKKVPQYAEAVVEQLSKPEANRRSRPSSSRSSGRQPIPPSPRSIGRAWRRCSSNMPAPIPRIAPGGSRSASARFGCRSVSNSGSWSVWWRSCFCSVSAVHRLRRRLARMPRAVGWVWIPSSSCS